MKDGELQQIEKKLAKCLRAKDKRKRKRMKVSGKGVFRLQKLMGRKK